MLLERSVDAIVAMLAILEAGAAYVPLEPSYPKERIAFIVKDACLERVIVHASLRDRLGPDVRTLLVSDDASFMAWPAAVVSAWHAAYVMYTSGSSGMPKGVEVVHRGIARLVRQVDYVELGPDRVLLQCAPLAFDASTFEIWGALLNGGRVVIHPEPVPTARGLRDVIARHGVTTMWLTAALFNAIIDDEPDALSGLRQLLIGGEALSVPHVRRALDALPETDIINGYGPTETTTFATCYTIPRSLDARARSIPIGRPIRDTQVYVLSPEQGIVAAGETGELYIGGSGLARGYLGQPELTAAHFVPNPFSSGERLYRTGDLVQVLPDGALDYVGRIDGQVKIRGFRIELGEIEAALGRHPAVERAVVVVREDTPGNKRLVAYVVARGTPPRPMDLRELLAATLPDYMVPAAFVGLSAIPVTANGKIDRRALPSPPNERPDLAIEYVAPATEREAALCTLFIDTLGVAQVGVLDNFFELGGNSLLALRVVGRLRALHGVDLPVLKLFERPTVRGLAAAIDGTGNDDASVLEAQIARAEAGVRAAGHPPSGVSEARYDAVAIVGMAGRFPGANTIDELWKVLEEGRETIRFFRDDELDPSVPAHMRVDPTYVKARGVLENIGDFEAGFFGVTPKEAEIMDPQQRVLLEVAWEALESAGHVPASFGGSIGVFAGKFNDSYWSENVVTRPDLVESLGAFQAMLGHEKDYVASRIAHKLDLTGPAVSVHTACSTSLVAICQAVRSLRARECDLALAGGVSLTVPTMSGYTYQEGAMLSNDGHTRSFDEGARGTVFSDGAGLVVLRRLEDAVRDGDTIHAVIRGVAVNNDGGHKSSFTAPCADGQTRVIAMAHADAGVDARSISYVEAHGTATPLGDPIEIEALTRAFRRKTADSGFCAVGSIKSNLGHTVIAAGVAGVFKTALALSNELIPATLHFRAPNPKIDLATGPFFVNDRARPWPRSSTPRRAGVSSFGVGGTNAHVVLEEAPLCTPSSASRCRQLLLLSARTPAALDAQTRALGVHLARHPEACLADVAFTLQTGRREFRHRRAIVAGDVREAAALLEGDTKRLATREWGSKEPQVVFMFPGQGAQYVNMGRTLYRDERVFRDEIDRCASHVPGLRELLFPADGDLEAAAASLRETRHTQPALFTVEYALAALWQSWGVRPKAMIGHSIGELVCAVLAEVMSLADALRLVVARGRLMFNVAPGSMLSVRLSAHEAAARLGPTLSIASDNGPSLCVVAGPTLDVDALRVRLEKDGIVCRNLHTSHAFHSSMMDAVVEPFTAVVRTVSLSAPRIPFVSTLTGTWISAEQARDPGYWGKHLRETVRFTQGVETLWNAPDVLLLEVGPRGTLTTLARQQVTDRSRQVAVASLGEAPDGDAETTALLQAAGHLWLAGVPIDRRAYWGRELRHRVPLPTYPFERRRYWIDSVALPPRELPQEKTPVTVQTSSRSSRFLPVLQSVFEDASGIEVAASDVGVSFLELGFDSLFLTQVALAVQKKFSVKVTFRQLLEDFPNLQTLAEHLEKSAPQETSKTAPVAPAPAPDVALPVMAAPSGSLQQVIEQQLRVMATQLAMMQGAPPQSPVPLAPECHPEERSDEGPQMSNGVCGVRSVAMDDTKKPFGAIARISVNRAETLTPKQRARLEAFTRRYTTRTKESKRWTQENRAHMADPRVVTGFRPAMKELVYPIVVARSAGSRLWDLDGNEYVDTLNGFGSNLFGWQPDFVTKALEEQLRTGHEIGPQSPLAGECAKLVCELTGFDRAAFCNTGSEAVMGTMRIARTVTGRSKIALFTGSYHGIFDEVIVRGTKRLKAIPAAPGIMKETSENVLVLDYGTPASLEILEAQAGNLAAILVEPVQSRRPDFQPRAFLHELRELTDKSGSVLIFDEVITGFRTCLGGAQEHFGVRADLASYGKVIGGGLPVGVIAGKRAFMDALDGGHWEFGDASVPTVGVTYFAGTFVRHPLALAAVKAVLLHLKEQGPRLQQETTAKAARLATELNAFFGQVGVPLEIRRFASLWRPFFVEEQPWSDLLFCMMRDRGVHIMDGFPCFFTTAHSEADVDFIVAQVKAAVIEMQESGFLPEFKTAARAIDTSKPPVTGARVGRDPSGDLAWFVPNPAEIGKYMKLEVPS